jgi:PLP dependent protein
MSDRRTELAENLSRVRQSIDQACVHAGREPQEVTLIAVTKTFPATDVRHLAELGVRNVGENRDQEASAKQRECADLDLTWHFIGQLQRNKARSVAAYADVVHSVDRLSLAQALSSAAAGHGRVLDILIQVNLDPEPLQDGRGGALPDEVASLAESASALGSLRIAGVMGVAPLGGDPAAAFALLQQVSANLTTRHPDARVISAGMSEDLLVAVTFGATHVRVGSALLGNRPPLH